MTIAFDVDGTLRNNTKINTVANENIRTLLVILSKFKNVKIVVWSGGGEIYARQMARELHITQFVDKYASKTDDIKIDIAIDDQQEFNLGNLNLIVKEK